MASPKKPPSECALRNAILWCARWMLGADGKVYEGRRLQVAVSANDSGKEIVVKPKGDADGRTEPGLLGASACGSGGEATPAELLAVLFSQDEIRILSEMLGDGPVKASGVQDGCRIEKSKFWVLWGNLQHRGVVGDPKDGEGFEIKLPWVREMVKARVEGAKPAA